MRDIIAIVEGYVEKELDFGDWPEEIEQHINEFIVRLREKNFQESFGRNRIGFISPNKRFVIKVPRNESGLYDNQKERRAYLQYGQENKNALPIAACRIFYADKNIGVPMLFMEYVEPVLNLINMPWWVDFVDCGQVGIDSKGRLVAYDL